MDSTGLQELSISEDDWERIRRAHFLRLCGEDWSVSRESLNHNIKVMCRMIIESNLRLAIYSNHTHFRALNQELTKWSTATGLKLNGSIVDLICNIKSEDVWTMSGPEEDLDYILRPMIVG